jgi:predicted DNA-binding transcriptional regulator AlpA
MHAAATRGCRPLAGNDVAVALERCAGEATARDRALSPAGITSRTWISETNRALLRRDRALRIQLQALAERCATSRPEIFRRLSAQASLGDFPEAWKLSVEERDA